MDTDWLNSPLGQRLLAAEGELLREPLAGIFGEHCVQVGSWGEPTTFLRHVRTQYAGIVAERAGDGVGALARAESLGLCSDSVDLLLLPHTLDYCERPHAVLREATRVLRSDGQMILLGFKPGGVWGLKRLWPGVRYPANTRQTVAERKLADWLELLDLRIVSRQRYFFSLPRQAKASERFPLWQSWGERFWPELASCYVFRVQKRLRTLTPVRTRWRRQKKVVAGLVKPSARVATDKAQASRVIEMPAGHWRRR